MQRINRFSHFSFCDLVFFATGCRETVSWPFLTPNSAAMNTKLHTSHFSLLTPELTSHLTLHTSHFPRVLSRPLGKIFIFPRGHVLGITLITIITRLIVSELYCYFSDNKIITFYNSGTCYKMCVTRRLQTYRPVCQALACFRALPAVVLRGSAYIYTLRRKIFFSRTPSFCPQRPPPPRGGVRQSK